MRKKYFSILCFMFCLFSLFGIGTNINNTVFAAETPPRDVTVTQITTKVRQGETYVNFKPVDPQNPMIGKEDFYRAKFNNKETPYLPHVIETKFKLSNKGKFEELDVNIKNQILAEIKWTINNQQISFNNSKAETEEFKLTLINGGKDLEIYAKKGGMYNIECFVDLTSANTKLLCEYLLPDKIIISSENSFDQLYEEFTDITLTATLNNAEFLNPEIEYTYKWYITSKAEENLIPDNTTNTLIITKDMIKIEKMKFIVVLMQDETVEQSQEITITTNQDYQSRLSITENKELKVTDDPLVLDTIIASSNYNVAWYLKLPNSFNFIKEDLDINQKNYTFNPAVKAPGEYKLFANISIVNDNKVIATSMTNVIKITVLKPEKEEGQEDVQLNITKTVYSNDNTGVQGFELSLNSEDLYSDEQLVWLVNGTAYDTGTKINFDPILVNDYLIEVRLLSDDGKIINPNGPPLTYITVKAEAVKTNTTIIVSVVAGIALVSLCVVSIIVSNKIREKIW